MDVSRVCDATPQQIREAVVEMVRADMAAAAGVESKDIAREDICAGVTYEKRIPNRMGKDERVKVLVSQLDDRGYAATFSSRYGKNGISYAFRVVEDGAGTEVTYGETFSGATASTGISHKLLAAVMRRGDRKRMLLQLEKFEEFVKSRI